MTLGLAAEPVLEAQMMPAGTVLVASEAMPDGILPDLLAGSGHDSLLQGLAMTPEISQAIPKPPAAPVPVHKLTRHGQVDASFWNAHVRVPRSLCGAFRRRIRRPGTAYAGKMGWGRK